MEEKLYYIPYGDIRLVGYTLLKYGLNIFDVDSTSKRGWPGCIQGYKFKSIFIRIVVTDEKIIDFGFYPCESKIEELEAVNYYRSECIYEYETLKLEDYEVASVKYNL